ncbi:claudin-17-like [Mugil cephalus]|uniref:claudin-17-like n=1 Tax=Mugil cephalus TaxID=48193 RepID=UPI001FB6D609|nr:claudin-17-like [Mugil cephalus]
MVEQRFHYTSRRETRLHYSLLTMKAKLEILAMVLGFIGLFGTIAATAMPTWRVSAYIGANLIVMEDLWEGLWMACYRQGNIRMQCKEYDSLLSLTPEIQAGRGLMCTSIVLVFLALLITGCGIKRCTCCGDNMKSKNITMALGGSFFLLSFLTTLIPVSWVGHTVIRNFYNPAVIDAEKRELGQALYIGWATSAVLLITGIIILVSYNKRSSKEELPYSETYYMAERNEEKQDNVNLSRTPSSFHKHQEYV